MNVGELKAELAKYPDHIEVEIDCIECGLYPIDFAELEESPVAGEDGVFTISTVW